MAATVTVNEVMEVWNGIYGRPRAILDTVLRALSTNLPSLLTTLGLPSIKAYHWAHEEIKHFPAVVVSGAVTTEQWGAGHADTMHVVASWVQAHPLSREDWQTALDMAAVMRGLLYAPGLRGPVRREDGNIVWDYTIPLGLSPIEPDTAINYGGFALNLEVHEKAGGRDMRTKWTSSPPVVTVSTEDALAILNGFGGRPRLVLDAMLEALETNLPAVLTHLGLPAVKGYFYAGEDIRDSNLPAIVVSCSTRFTSMGTHFADAIHAVAHYLVPAPISRRGKALAIEVGNAIRAVLRTGVFVGPYRETDEGPHVWHQLQSTGVTPLPVSPEQDYGGAAVHFEAIQNPPGAEHNELWPTS